MSIYQKNNTSYGLSQPLVGVQGGPIVANRAPTTADKAPIGITWVDQVGNATYILTSIVTNIATWTPTTGGGGGPGIFSSVTATAIGGVVSQIGDITANAGNIVATLGNITATAGGIFAVAGNISALAGSVSAGAMVQATTGVSTIDGNITIGSSAVAVASNALIQRKIRGAGTIVVGDELGNIIFEGFDGGAYQVGAKITSVSTDVVAAGRIPANLHFWTKPNGAGVLASRLEINSAGNVTINAPDAGVGLTIANGGLTVTAGGLTVAAGVITTPLGIGVLLNSAAGVVSSEVPGVAGTVLTSNGAAVAPTWQPVAAGVIPWTRDVVGGNIPLLVNHGYICTVAGSHFTLPAVSAIGDVIYMTGEWPAGIPANWYVQCGAGQRIIRSTLTSTVAGRATSSDSLDSIVIRCKTANTLWMIESTSGIWALT